MGLHRRQPKAVPSRDDAAAGTSIPERRWIAGAVRLPARHGARAERSQPPLEPGPRSDVRGRVGQGAAVSRARRIGGGPTRRAVLAASLGALATLAGCTRDEAPRYQGGWVGANITLAVAQIIAYLLVGALVLTAPKSFFGRGRAATGSPAGGPIQRSSQLQPGLPERPALRH